MLSNIRFYWSALCKICLGEKEDFTMENRMLNMACLMVLAVLTSFFIINAFTGLWQRSIIVLAMFVCELVVYYYSRFKHKASLGLVINGLLSYAALAFNYFISSGINGPTLLLFIFTLHLLICATPNKLHLLWFLLHGVTITLLLVAEFMYPSLIKYSYRDNVARTVDIVATYAVSILFIFQVTRYVRGYYETEKRLAQEYELKLKAFFDSSEICHVLLDRDCRILYFNNTAANFIRDAYNKKLTSGGQIFQFVNPAYAKGFERNCREALAGNVVQDDRMLAYEKLGNIWWHFAFRPVWDELGEVVGFSFNAEDITAAKTQELELQQKNELLLKISRMQSGQLRQPVASIIALMNLMKDDSANAAEYQALMKGVTEDLDNKIYNIIAQTKE